MLERTIRVTHPRNHYTKLSHVRGLNGTVGERLLQRDLGASNEQSNVTKQIARW